MLNILEQSTKVESYGCEYFGRLKSVLVHNPCESLKLITDLNYKDWLFDAVPDADKFQQEHRNWVELLKSYDVKVFEVRDYVNENQDLIDQLPNLVYMHDSSVITRQGAILSKMSSDSARRGEDMVVKEALLNLGIPIFWEFPGHEQFEGCLLLSPETVLIADTERHHPHAIENLIPHILTLFKEVIYLKIPQRRRFMHPDTVYNRISEDLALVYLPAILEVQHITHEKHIIIEDFNDFMYMRGIELLNISSEEQLRLGCTFVPLQPGIIFHYDNALKPDTKKKLQRRGVEIIEFHPEALLAGGGSLRCITLRLHRE